MFYAIVDGSGQIIRYPYTLTDLKRDHPNTSFPRDFPQRPEDLEPYQLVAVLDPEPLDYDAATQVLEEGDLLQTANGYQRQYVVRALTVEELSSRADYLAFWDALLISAVYQTIRAQALTNPAVLVACTEFIAAIGDAKFGRANVPAIQACIDYLMAAATFTESELLELQTLMSDNGMLGVYNLSVAP